MWKAVLYQLNTKIKFDVSREDVYKRQLLIVRARQAAAVSLIPIEQGKPYRLFLVRRKGVPCVGRCLCQSVTCFQGDTGLDTERRFPVHIHTVLVISRAARSITVNDSTGIVPHGLSLIHISFFPFSLSAHLKSSAYTHRRKSHDRTYIGDKGRSYSHISFCYRSRSSPLFCFGAGGLLYGIQRSLLYRSLRLSLASDSSLQ